MLTTLYLNMRSRRVSVSVFTAEIITNSCRAMDKHSHPSLFLARVFFRVSSVITVHFLYVLFACVSSVSFFRFNLFVWSSIKYSGVSSIKIACVSYVEFACVPGVQVTRLSSVSVAQKKN